ncbi:MAG: class I SAM-dependent methyltransferase [Planctomycetota bacterium]
MSFGHQIKKRLPPILRFVFRVGQRLGVNITPNHFYSDIPDMRQLESSTTWRKRQPLHGVLGTGMDQQADRFADCCGPYPEQMSTKEVCERAWRENGEPGYGIIESLALYGFVRRHKPKRIVQIGCGVSTAVCLHAAEDEPDYEPQIECLEPYPTQFLRNKAKEGKITLQAQPAQDTPAEQIADLEPGDLLFIDSTHTIKIGSEVVHVILDVIPRLKPGVFVHFHDITLPYDYNAKTLSDSVFFWRETTMLAALLTDNPKIGIYFSMTMLNHDRPERVQEVIPFYSAAPTKDGLRTGDGNFPSSIFLQTQQV